MQKEKRKVAADSRDVLVRLEACAPHLTDEVDGEVEVTPVARAVHRGAVPVGRVPAVLSRPRRMAQ